MSKRGSKSAYFKGRRTLKWKTTPDEWRARRISHIRRWFQQITRNLRQIDAIEHESKQVQEKLDDPSFRNLKVASALALAHKQSAIATLNKQNVDLYIQIRSVIEEIEIARCPIQDTELPKGLDKLDAQLLPIASAKISWRSK